MKTYNHEKFIAKAIDSALVQEVNFPYEIVIGEDCSTDNTRNIVIDYKNKYPDKIRLLLHQENIGMRKNFMQLLKSCSGRYIAELEGDDYWTSSQKLQKQVDFLDDNPEFSICFHPVRMCYDEATEEKRDIFPLNMKDVSTLEDLFEYNFIPTCSVMYRNNLINEFPDWLYKLKMGDWSLHILNYQYGNIKFLN